MTDDEQLVHHLRNYPFSDIGDGQFIVQAADTIERLTAEIQQKDRDIFEWKRKLREARTEIRHGQAREKVMREGLESLAKSYPGNRVTARKAQDILDAAAAVDSQERIRPIPRAIFRAGWLAAFDWHHGNEDEFLEQEKAIDAAYKRISADWVAEPTAATKQCDRGENYATCVRADCCQLAGRSWGDAATTEQ